MEYLALKDKAWGHPTSNSGQRNLEDDDMRASAVELETKGACPS